MKLVATVYGDDQPEKSTTEMEALLANYPDLKGVIAPTTVGIAAAAQVVQSRGIADKVQVTGLGLPSEMRDFVKDGTVNAFQLWSPYNEGWLAAHFADGVTRRHDQERGRRDLRSAEPRHDHDQRQQLDQHPGRADHLRRREHRRLRLLIVIPRTGALGPRRRSPGSFTDRDRPMNAYDFAGRSAIVTGARPGHRAHRGRTDARLGRERSRSGTGMPRCSGPSRTGWTPPA